MRPIQNGFTLIELMVTLVVAMLLVGVGAPSLKAMYEGYRTDSQIRKVNQSLQFARSHAVSYGSRVTMCPIVSGSCNADWSKGFKIFLDNGAPNQIDGNDEVLTVVGPFNSSDFVSFAPSAINFTTDGLTSAGLFIYCPGSKVSDETMGLQINASGTARFSTATNLNCN
ncbi:prepilin-type N-terminal cleavage/methylation domain-containing protein [Shewanella psychropiezotolerans]|uniref:Type II secretion system protein H n=1 Tax=Shewanella psychropiezotolerans TaxID=2593655 RepID=A0ABX5X1V2_9GAMM|nr:MULTISPECIES: GspH/FimT family pseudopilin [Shewanella]MPY20996.1 prepilin-type N-terminal cleavage/methylation domain-containing protein [Shewanella sp. YLB-07]MPY21783.1 prepilin-type N-terminal cleavage/methylation domain-containing protein [Shewanella sp. YLB-07]QDO85324.1 prepilin-type N-terminal cleavage/methylation domain-containing protein [Shewanella psychropiezotolerans]